MPMSKQLHHMALSSTWAHATSREKGRKGGRSRRRNCVSPCRLRRARCGRSNRECPCSKALAARRASLMDCVPTDRAMGQHTAIHQFPKSSFAGWLIDSFRNKQIQHSFDDSLAPSSSLADIAGRQDCWLLAAGCISAAVSKRATLVSRPATALPSTARKAKHHSRLTNSRLGRTATANACIARARARVSLIAQR